MSAKDLVTKNSILLELQQSFRRAVAALKMLFVTNPMLVEIQREKNKALAAHNWRGGQLAARVLLGLVYLSILALLLRYIEDVEPVILMYVLLAMLTIMVPAALYGTIAGEREKRSLDLLLVAPVTAGQIVVGKFGRGFVSMIAITVAIGLPAFVVEVVRQIDPPYYYQAERNGFLGFFISLAFCITAGLAVGGLTMWISSKTRTASAAILSTVGAIFLLLAVTPAIALTMEQIAPAMSELILNMNPFVGLAGAYSGEAFNYDQHLPNALYTGMAMTAYLLVAVVTLYMATQNVKELAKGRVV